MIKFKLGLFSAKFNHMVVAFLVVLIVIVILIFRLIKITFPPPPLLLYCLCYKIMPLRLNKTLNIFAAESCMLLEWIITSLNSAFGTSRNEYDPLGFIPATFLQTLSSISLITVGIYTYFSYDTICIQKTFCKMLLRRILKSSLLLPVVWVMGGGSLFISGLC
jgi:hypothetical protein